MAISRSYTNQEFPFPLEYDLGRFGSSSRDKSDTWVHAELNLKAKLEFQPHEAFAGKDIYISKKSTWKIISGNWIRIWSK